MEKALLRPRREETKHIVKARRLALCIHDHVIRDSKYAWCWCLVRWRGPLSLQLGWALKTCRWELLVLPFFPSPTSAITRELGNSHRLLPLVSSRLPIRPSPSAATPPHCSHSFALNRRRNRKGSLQSTVCTTARLSCCPPSPSKVANQGPSSAGTELFRLHIFALLHVRGRKRVVRTASEAIGVNWVHLRLAVADWSKRHWAAAPCRPGAAQLARIRATTQIPDSTWLSPPWVVPTSPADGLHEGTTTATDGPPTTSSPPSVSRSSTYARPPPPPPPPPRVPDRQTTADQYTADTPRPPSVPRPPRPCCRYYCCEVCDICDLTTWPECPPPPNRAAPRPRALAHSTLSTCRPSVVCRLSPALWTLLAPPNKFPTPSRPPPSLPRTDRLCRRGTVPACHSAPQSLAVPPCTAIPPSPRSRPRTAAPSRPWLPAWSTLLASLILQVSTAVHVPRPLTTRHPVGVRALSPPSRFCPFFTPPPPPSSLLFCRPLPLPLSASSATLPMLFRFWAGPSKQQRL